MLLLLVTTVSFYPERVAADDILRETPLCGVETRVTGACLNLHLNDVCDSTGANISVPSAKITSGDDSHSVFKCLKAKIEQAVQHKSARPSGYGFVRRGHFPCQRSLSLLQRLNI